ncbi:PBECR2 nuclease fold domain-containing protein [Neptuniibacter sp.]|uniref:PBECR2 nuclease fold domain-containing protein n=1 Tax=Neptuniibacter sp. TaxID=1962643 RepID=UPI003B5BDA51
MADAVYGSVPFREQSEFFRRKLNLPTNHWTDIYNAEHDWAFVVAGANRDAIVQDFRVAIEKAIASGTTLEEFRKDFDDIVARYGWDYNGGREWRSRTIYETNLFSSYNAGRLQQLSEMTDVLPYWRYNHSDAVEHPRQEHLKWDGKTLRADDPWWKTHFTPNGWGCQCYITAHTEEDLIEMGKDGPDTAPPINWEVREIGLRNPNGPRKVRVPAGIDPGFEHAPGQSRLQSSIPPERPEPPIPGSTGVAGLPNTRPQSSLPAPRQTNTDKLLPTDLNDEQYALAFLEYFGGSLDKPALIRDAVGEPLVLGKELFIQRRSGKFKANKSGRGQYMLLLADALLDPDEIWVRIEYQAAQKRAVVRRRYIAQFEIPGQLVPSLAVFEWSNYGWSGITIHTNERDLEDSRVGVRVYRRNKAEE